MLFLLASAAGATSYVLAAGGSLPVSMELSDAARREITLGAFAVGAVADCAVERRRRDRVLEEHCRLREVQLLLKGEGAEGAHEAVAAELIAHLQGREVWLRRQRSGTLRSVALDPDTAPEDFRLRANVEVAEALLGRAFSTLDLRPPPEDATERPWTQLSDLALQVPPFFSALGASTVAHRAWPAESGLRVETAGRGRFADPNASSNACDTELHGLALVDEEGLASRRLELSGLFVIPMEQEVAFGQDLGMKRLGEEEDPAVALRTLVSELAP